MAEITHTKSAKNQTEEHAVTYFAKTNFRQKEVVFGVKSRDRRQHMYVIGKTGTGKTTLLNNLALQDIKMGRGICIVDPHGEFVENILRKVPAERINDVIYLNPADTEYPIGFNVLEVPDAHYKHLIASDLMGIFTKIWANVWSARMEYILNNCVLALLDTPGTTLLGIPRILVDKDYREKILANVKDPVVKAFWVHEYEGYNERFRGEAIAPIQNKVGQFLSTPLIRNIVGQGTSTINIQDIMNSGKILLVNVSKGRIGEDNSALLGAMLITKIQLAAMERIRIPEDERRDFYLYVDEFQNFATDSFAGILSEARKYALNLVVAHQYIGQLVTDVSTKVRDAIFGNVGTMIVFRVGAADAEFLEPEFEPEFVIQDLVNLPNREIYVKLMVDGTTSRPFSASTLPPMAAAGEEENREKIIEVSREQYARPVDEVEEQINSWSGMMRRGGEDGGGREANRGDAGTQYEISCSSCGKRSRVSFAPDPGRPVYCQDCLKKIKAGELSPLRVRRVPAERGGRESGHESHLGDLGIEFSAPMENQPARNTETKAPAGQSSGRGTAGGPGFGRDGDRAAVRERPPVRIGGQFNRRFASPASPRGRLNLPQTMARGIERRDFREARRDIRQEHHSAPFAGGPARSIAPQPKRILGGVRGEPVVRTPQEVPKASLSILKKADEKDAKDTRVSNDAKDMRGGLERAPERARRELDVAGLRAMLEESLKATETKEAKDAKSANVAEKIETPQNFSEGKLSEASKKSGPPARSVRAGTLKPGESVKL
jgi:CxxC-x17-CxxC domain-containing protein